MGEETMTEFKTEGQPAFPVANNENDNSSTSSTDQTNTDQTGSPEQDKTQADNKNGGTEKDNFADHPRWKERESDWTNRFNDQEKRHVDEIAKLRAEFLGNNKGETKTATHEVPTWFGGDDDAWSQYSSHTQQLISQAVEKAVAAIGEKSTAEQKKIDEATNYMKGQLSEIEADKNLNPDGKQVDQNKLLKYVIDNELVDTQGRWNYKAAFKMMKAEDVFKAKGALNEKKQIASATTSDNRAETKPPAFMTNKDFSKPENRPW